MIHNLHLIKPLLTLTDEGDFVQLYVFKRKKDQPEGEKDNHQSVRTIRSYSIESIEKLEKRMPEVIQLCEMFKARAYIHINKQNHADIGLLMMERLAQRLRNGVIRQNYIFDSIVGEIHSKQKRWIVDVDTTDPEHIANVKCRINNCRPDNNLKIIETIPTRNGVHIISHPFDVADFKAAGFTEDIQKNNPTLLYLPNSLQ